MPDENNMLYADPDPVHVALRTTSVGTMSLDTLDGEIDRIDMAISKLRSYRIMVEKARTALWYTPHDQLRIVIVKKKESVRWYQYYIPGPKTVTVYHVTLQAVSGDIVFTLRSRTGRGRDSRKEMTQYLSTLLLTYPGITVDGSL